MNRWVFKSSLGISAGRVPTGGGCHTEGGVGSGVQTRVRGPEIPGLYIGVEEV